MAEPVAPAQSGADAVIEAPAAAVVTDTQPSQEAMEESTAPSAPDAPGPLDPAEVLRIAHERFLAERRSAEESASKARAFAAAH